MEHPILKLNEENKIADGSLNWSNSTPYAQGSESGLVQFVLLCQNIPDGTIIGLSSDRPGPVPPIYLQPTTVIYSGRFSAGANSDVPANYECIITYYANFNQQPPADAYITLQAVSSMPPG